MKNQLIILISIISIFSGCRDIFEEDISEKVPALLAPVHSEISDSNNINFKWSEMEGAREFTIEVVTPSFDSLVSFVYDSTLINASVTLPMSPGSYEWRVKGINDSYETQYSEIRSLTIDSSYNLTNQSVLLFSPLNNAYFNYSNIDFSWQDLYAADNFRIIIKDNADWSVGSELINVSIPTSSYQNIDSLTEGSYSWGVSAENSIPSATDIVSPRAFYIDQTDPNDPVIVSPNLSSVSLFKDSLIDMNWTRPSDAGVVQSPISDWVEVYQDTLLSPVISSLVVLEDTTFTFGTAGTYFWRIYSEDEATNTSYWTPFTSFYIQ